MMVCKYGHSSDSCLSVNKYCRFGNFRENFIFANSIKIHISGVKYSRLRQDLPISIIDKVILPFSRGFYFHETSHMRSFAKIKSSRKFPNLQYVNPCSAEHGYFSLENGVDQVSHCFPL